MNCSPLTVLWDPKINSFSLTLFWYELSTLPPIPSPSYVSTSNNCCYTLKSTFLTSIYERQQVVFNFVCLGYLELVARLSLEHLDQNYKKSFLRSSSYIEPQQTRLKMEPSILKFHITKVKLNVFLIFKKSRRNEK